MMKSQVQCAVAEGRKLIFVDEAMFTTASRVTLAYAPKNMNVFVDEMSTSVKALAVVAGVSTEKGLETFLMCPKSINS
jgi:hypothetical protein